MRRETQKVTAVVATPNQITDSRIAERAHEKWQQRGCPLWDDTADWFAALAELEQLDAISKESATAA